MCEPKRENWTWSFFTRDCRVLMAWHDFSPDYVWLGAVYGLSQYRQSFCVLEGWVVGRLTPPFMIGIPCINSLRARRLESFLLSHALWTLLPYPLIHGRSNIRTKCMNSEGRNEQYNKVLSERVPLRGLSDLTR